MKQYTLTRQLIARILAGLRSFDPPPKTLKCYKCGEPLREGDVVVSCRMGHCGQNRRTKSRVYHLQCYESLFFEPREDPHNLSTDDRIKSQRQKPCQA